VDGADDRAKCFTLEEPDGDASLMALGVAGPDELPAALERQTLHDWCIDGSRQ
jgi:hypothetical protein